jgi:hypothetical protein
LQQFDSGGAGLTRGEFKHLRAGFGRHTQSVIRVINKIQTGTGANLQNASIVWQVAECGRTQSCEKPTIEWTHCCVVMRRHFIVGSSRHGEQFEKDSAFKVRVASWIAFPSEQNNDPRITPNTPTHDTGTEM